MNNQIRQPAIETIPVSIDEKLVMALNRWRLAQTPVPSQSDAIALLLTIGLTCEGVAVDSAEPLPTPEDPIINKLMEAFSLANKRSKF